MRFLSAMDSLTPDDEGGAEGQSGFESSEIETNPVEVKNRDAAHDSGAGGLNPIKKLGVMSATLVSAEDRAVLPKVPVFKAPSSMPPPSLSSASMPPPSMPPSKITKANLPGPMGPPPMRVKQSKEVKEPVQSAAAEGILSICVDLVEKA